MVNVEKKSGLFSQFFRFSSAQKVLALHPLAAFQLHFEQFEGSFLAGNDKLLAIDDLSWLAFAICR